MAIVKFISDKSCLLFIDMELVGEVRADKMLKVSLETGSYLVEAKNADGICLKKYELKITLSDNQILQNLAIETIDMLENDEKFKCDKILYEDDNYIIYRKDGICIIKDRESSYFFKGDRRDGSPDQFRKTIEQEIKRY